MDVNTRFKYKYITYVAVRVRGSSFKPHLYFRFASRRSGSIVGALNPCLILVPVLLLSPRMVLVLFYIRRTDPGPAFRLTRYLEQTIKFKLIGFIFRSTENFNYASS